VSGGLPQPNQEFDFAHNRPADEPALPPAIPAKTRITGRAWTMGLASFALLFLLGVGTTLFFIFSPPFALNDREPGSSASHAPSVNTPRLANPMAQESHDAKLEAENRKLSEQLAAAQKRGADHNALPQLLEMLENEDQHLQVMYDQRNAARSSLATKDKELKLSQEQIAKSKKEQGVDSQQKSREAIKDVEPGLRLATNGSMPSLKRVRSYCALPLLKLPNGTMNLNKPEALKLELDLFNMRQLKFHPPVAQDASQRLKLIAQAEKDSDKVLVGSSDGDKENSVAKFELKEHEITFEWLKDATDQARDWISNSVLEISGRAAGNAKPQFVGLKSPSTNGVEVQPFHLEASGKYLVLGRLPKNAPNRELFVASASFDISKSNPDLEISWQSDALIIAMQLSAEQDKEGKQLRLLVRRQTAEQPHAQDPLITLRSCVICSRQEDLAIEEFRYTNPKYSKPIGQP
jgi:hypothetical protein